MDFVTWSPGMSLKTIERLIIKAAFKFHRGDKTSMANTLGISRQELDDKILAYDADDKLTLERQERLTSERQAFIRRQRGLDPPLPTVLKVQTSAPFVDDDDDLMGAPLKKSGTRGRR